MAPGFEGIDDLSAIFFVQLRILPPPLTQHWQADDVMASNGFRLMPVLASYTQLVNIAKC